MVGITGGRGGGGGMVHPNVMLEIAKNPKGFEKRIAQFEEQRDASTKAAQEARAETEKLERASAQLQKERKEFTKEKEDFERKVAQAWSDVHLHQNDAAALLHNLEIREAELESRVEQNASVEKAQAKKAVQLSKLEGELTERESALIEKVNALQTRELELAGLEGQMMGFLSSKLGKK